MNAENKTSKLKKLSPCDKGYIAGILDGEGHLYVIGAYRESSYSRVRVRMTDKCVIDHLIKITGVGLRSAYMPTQLRKDGKPRRKVYEWTVARRTDVRDLLKAVFDHLVLKKKQAAALLELESLKDQGAASGRGYEAERIRRVIAKWAGH